MSDFLNRMFSAINMAALASTMAWINFGIYFVGVMAVSGNWL